MPNREAVEAFRRSVQQELTDNILPFWLCHTVDRTHGGFYGYISNELDIYNETSRSSVLNTRILWTFSRAHQMFGLREYLDMANWAYDDLKQHFWDPLFSGVYWSVDHLGNPFNPKKRTYCQAFAIYGLSEFYRATGQPESLARAIELMELIERYAADQEFGGYLEAFGRDWRAPDGMVLSSINNNDEEKTMNTHIHVLEAYMNLITVWDHPNLRTRLMTLVETILQRILNPDSPHFNLAFDRDWRVISGSYNYGHDIEGVWLMLKAVELLGDAGLVRRVEEWVVRIADAIVEEGMDEDGGLFYEGDGYGVTDDDKHWWPQAEALVGLITAYEVTGDERYWDAVIKCWGFIKTTIVDEQYGEWVRNVSRNGRVNPHEAKAGFWKCPYHNGRACMELIERLEAGRLMEARILG